MILAKAERKAYVIQYEEGSGFTSTLVEGCLRKKIMWRIWYWSNIIHALKQQKEKLHEFYAE